MAPCALTLRCSAAGTTRSGSARVLSKQAPPRPVIIENTAQISRRGVLSSVIGAGIAAGLATQPLPASAVECSLMGKVPCFPAPANGEPRYKTFDGPLYDPAKAAEERLKAKLAAPAPAPAPAAPSSSE